VVILEGGQELVLHHKLWDLQAEASACKTNTTQNQPH